MRWIRRSVTIAAAALLLGAPLSAARAAVCTTPTDETALSARVLQTELMVAALSCQANSRYNAFVAKFESELIPQGIALRKFFDRVYGEAGESRLTSFVTALANERSGASINNWSGYCQQADAMFARVLALPAGGLAGFAALQPFSAAHGFSACSVTVATEPEGR